MAIEIKETKRIFRVVDAEYSFDLSDPHTGLTPVMVVAHYRPHYKVLEYATFIGQRICENEIIYEILISR